MSQETARNILVALRAGGVPVEGFEMIAVGLDREMSAIATQMDRVATGYGDFKFIRGDYGSGKSFLSAMTMDQALSKNFLVSTVVISTDTPMDRLDAVYYRFVSNLRSRGQAGGVLRSLIDRWIYHVEERIIQGEGLNENDPKVVERTMEEIEGVLKEISTHHSGFAAAVRGYYQAVVDDHHQSAQTALGWLSGERNMDEAALGRVGLRGFIDATMVFPFFRAIGIVARQAGHPGVVVTLDEVETIQRMDVIEREQGLNNLRQVVDALVGSELPNYYFLITGTPTFFEGEKGVPSLPPLDQRIHLADPDSEFPNYDHPQLSLRKFTRDKLKLVADKVRNVYRTAFPGMDLSRGSDEFADRLIEKLSSKFDGNVSITPRAFLMLWVDALDRIRQHPAYDPLRHYDFENEVQAKEGMLAREIRALGKTEAGPSGVARFYFDRNKRTNVSVEGRSEQGTQIFLHDSLIPIASPPTEEKAQPADGTHFDLGKFISIDTAIEGQQAKTPADGSESLSDTKIMPRISETDGTEKAALSAPSEPVSKDATEEDGEDAQEKGPVSPPSTTVKDRHDEDDEEFDLSAFQDEKVKPPAREEPAAKPEPGMQRRPEPSKLPEDSGIREAGQIKREAHPDFPPLPARPDLGKTEPMEPKDFQSAQEPSSPTAFPPPSPGLAALRAKALENEPQARQRTLALTKDGLKQKTDSLEKAAPSSDKKEPGAPASDASAEPGAEPLSFFGRLFSKKKPQSSQPSTLQGKADERMKRLLGAKKPKKEEET